MVRAEGEFCGHLPFRMYTSPTLGFTGGTVSEDGAAERFWLQLQALYQAAGKPTLKRLVHLGLEQRPPLSIGHATINGWLNRKAVPTGRKNERYLAAMVAFLQSRVRAGDGYARLPEGEWMRLLRAAQAQRAEAKRQGRPRRPDTSRQSALSHELRERIPSVAAHRAIMPAVARGPFIGRSGELALLADLVRRVAAGQGGMVCIEGEPGIGKSTLVQAALADAAGLGCQVFWGTASELDEALPLQPLLDGLRVRDTPANPRREAIARFLRGELGVDRGVDGPTMLAEQLLALIAEECARPAILVIDDLQWADRASIRLLARLASSVRQLPLLLVTMMRPVPQRDELLPLRRASGGAGQLQLTGLTEAHVATLVGSLAGGTPDSDLLRLARDAAGNPLYLTELIAALNRSSMVTVAEDGTATLAAGPAPRSLSAAIADRLDFIAKPTRGVLQSASLLGPEFTVTDLATLLGRSVADLAANLREASSAGILSESGTQLRFRHPLIHTALYEELPGPVRAAWHREAGRALAAAGAPADRVARQLALADGEQDGSPAARLDSWAIDWLAGAAESLISQAPQVAARLLTRAVAGMPVRSAQRSLLASHLADALFRTGERTAAEQLAATELARTDDPDVLVGLHWTLAQCRIQTGTADESLATLEHVLQAPGFSARHRGRLRVLTARTHLSCGEFEKADQVASAVLAEAETAGDTWAEGWALHTMAVVAMIQGRLVERLPLFDQGLAVSEADPALADLRLLIQLNKAVALATLDRHEEALAIAQQARRLANQVGSAVRLVQAHNLLGQLLFETGRWDDALAELSAMPESLKESAEACCDRAIAALISFHRGETANGRGYLGAANSHPTPAGFPIPQLTLARSLDQELAGAQSTALATLTRWFKNAAEVAGMLQDLVPDAIRLAMRLGDVDAARTVARQSIEFADSVDTPYLQANALYCRGLLAHDPALLLDAAERYRQASRPLLRAKALEAAASACARTGDEAQAQAVLADATEIYAWLGAAATARVTAANQTVDA